MHDRHKTTSWFVVIDVESKIWGAGLTAEGAIFQPARWLKMSTRNLSRKLVKKGELEQDLYCLTEIYGQCPPVEIEGCHSAPGYDVYYEDWRDFA